MYLMLKFCRSMIAVTLLAPSSYVLAIETETNSPKLSKLEWAKRNAYDFEHLASLTEPSVVVVESVDRTGRKGGVGTGFVVSADGVIATNFHVIGEHRDFSIRFSNDQSYRPKSIIGIDRSRDLALVKIDVENLPVLELGNSDKLVPGEAILSLGNPLGYGHSVSRGVIAGLREIEPGDGKPMVQVAIPIEPGSSGSPVLNLEGQVVAILCIKTGGAMGFGVPANALRNLMNENNDPIPMKKWLTIGALDELEWKPVMDGSWTQRAGIIKSIGLGSGFGGRMLCLHLGELPDLPYELEVEVKLDNESGAAGLAFHSDGHDKHYGFYPTNGSLRLTRFEGPNVLNWTILKTIDSSAYNPNQWNLLKVRVEEDGRIRCYANGEEIIDMQDLFFTRGRIGLCKFREPSAVFRNFRFSKRFPKSEATSKVFNRVRKIMRNQGNSKDLSQAEMQSLLDLGPASPQAINDYALELEKKAKYAKELSNEVRERLVISDLVESLNHENEKSVDLLKSALLIARLDNANFDLSSYLRRADQIAKKIREKFPSNSSEEERLRILVFQLFEEMGFHGSTLDYHHRSNSYMNEVMDDREGLPITLSILFIELANRLEIPVSGVGLPGHFIAMYRESPKQMKKKQSSPKEILIDAFGGKIIDKREAAQITGIRLNELDFKPTPQKEIITRMLRNLIQSADHDQDQRAKLRYIDAILAISPEDRFTRVMRTMIHYGNGNFNQALKDIDILLQKEPESHENGPLLEIRSRLIEQGASVVR